MMFSSVDLPQPDGPRRQTNSPSPTGETDVLEHADAAAVALERHADADGAQFGVERGDAVRHRATAASHRNIPN